MSSSPWARDNCSFQRFTKFTSTIFLYFSIYKSCSSELKLFLITIPAAFQAESWEIQIPDAISKWYPREVDLVWDLVSRDRWMARIIVSGNLLGWHFFHPSEKKGYKVLILLGIYETNWARYLWFHSDIFYDRHHWFITSKY